MAIYVSAPMALIVGTFAGGRATLITAFRFKRTDHSFKLERANVNKFDLWKGWVASKENNRYSPPPNGVQQNKFQNLPGQAGGVVNNTIYMECIATWQYWIINVVGRCGAGVWRRWPAAS